jgi:hypothetical protein
MFPESNNTTVGTNNVNVLQNGKRNCVVVILKDGALLLKARGSSAIQPNNSTDMVYSFILSHYYLVEFLRCSTY